MGLGWRLAALGIGLMSVVSLRADLKRAQAESNLEKRSQLAMDNAAAAYQAARAAYDKGDNEQAARSSAEIQESVDLASVIYGTGWRDMGTIRASLIADCVPEASARDSAGSEASLRR